jgi:signal transduction histidine kinase
LISNAIKFCNPNDGKIHMEVRQDGDWISVSVEDNGMGVPAPLKEKIFERFHQSTSSMGNKPQGSGLGLAISRQIVTYLGGRIWAENSHQGGACFTFTLPLQPAEDVKLSGD